MLIENPGAVLDGRRPEPSQAWLDFVLSDEGQRQFALTGFRPVRDDVDYGGASRVPTTRPTRSRRCPTSSRSRRTSAAGTRSSDKFFDEEDGLVIRGHRRRRSRRSNDLDRRRTWPTGEHALAGRPPRSHPDPVVGPRARRRHDLVQPAGPDPARRRRGHRRRGRLGGLLVDASPTSRPRPPSGSPSAPLCVVTAVNVVMGTLIAWVLVRDRFWGKRCSRS